MDKEDLPEKKLRIRPREVKETEKGEEGDSPAEPSRLDQIRRMLLTQSGTKFPGRTPTPRDPRKHRQRRNEDPPPEKNPDEPTVPEKTPGEKARPEDSQSSQPVDRATAAPSGQAAGKPPEEPNRQGKPSANSGENVWNSPAKSPPEEAREAAPRPVRSQFVADQVAKAWKRFNRQRIPAPWVVAGVVVVGILGLIWGFRWGNESARANAGRLAAMQHPPVGADALDALNLALANLRLGDASRALENLKRLESTNPEISGLTYLVALAALQTGEMALAQEKIDDSLAKRERVSDSLALQAVLETQKQNDPSIRTFGDPKIRSEEYLRRAMTADAANPYPLIELGTLLRYQKRTAEARELLKGARSRLQPVDSTTVIDVSLALMDLEETPDSELTMPELPGKDATSLFAAAYVCLRLGDPDRAAEFLRNARTQLSTDLFDYLIYDPVFRRYTDEPKMKEFFE